MKTVSREMVLELHWGLVEKFGGIQGIRDEGLLDSALNAPFQTFFGADLYPTIPEKAARLGYGLVKNHPFLDGNKRTGAHTMLVFLAVNRIPFSCTNEELTELFFHIADGTADCEALLKWLYRHIE